MLLFKILTLKELDLIGSFFKKDTKPNKIIMKCINLLKRFTRKNEDKCGFNKRG